MGVGRVGHAVGQRGAAGEIDEVKRRLQGEKRVEDDQRAPDRP